MPEDGVGLCVAKWRAGDGLQRLCGGEAEVQGQGGGEAREAGEKVGKGSAESEEEWLEMWVLQALRAEVEFFNVVQAMHNLVMHGVAELEEWRKEARAEWEAVVEEWRNLQGILMRLGEKVMVEKVVVEVAEKKVE